MARIRLRSGLWIGLGLGLLTGGGALATDQTIRGNSLTVKDPDGVNDTRKVVVVGKEKLSPNTIVGEPTQAGPSGGASLTVSVDGASPSSQTFILPQGTSSATGKPFWMATSTPGFQYRDLGGDNAPVKVALIKRSATGTVTLKAVIEGKRGPVTILPPNPGSGGCMVFQLGMDGSGDRYSVAFGPGSTLKNNGALLFKASKTLAEDFCPGLPGSTSTTSSTTSTSSSTSSTSSSSTSSTSSSTSSSATTSSTTSTSSSTSATTSSTSSTSSSTTSSTESTTSTTESTTSTSTSTTATTSSTTSTTSSSTSTTESTSSTSTSTTESTSSTSTTSTSSTSSSTTSTIPVTGCGNGVREGDEECDGGDASACLGACEASCDCAPPPRKIAVAGDSISQAFAADCTSGGFSGALCLALGDKPQYSWFNGTNAAVDSVHKQYLAINGAVLAERESVSGAEMRGGGDSFAAQAARILTQSPVPDHVEVLLGGNDICNRDCINPSSCGNPVYTDTQWRDAVRAGLDVLMDGLPNGSTVYLLGIPRVQDLRGVGLAKAGTNCDSQWSTFGICRIATNGGTLNGETFATRQAGIAERQQRYNEILRDEAIAYNANTTGQNPRGLEVVADYVDELTPSVGTTTFLTTDIDAADCFHPSIAGQDKLGEGTFLLNPDRP